MFIVRKILSHSEFSLFLHMLDCESLFINGLQGYEVRLLVGAILNNNFRNDEQNPCGQDQIALNWRFFTYYSSSERTGDGNIAISVFTLWMEKYFFCPLRVCICLNLIKCVSQMTHAGDTFCHRRDDEEAILIGLRNRLHSQHMRWVSISCITKFELTVAQWMRVYVCNKLLTTCDEFTYIWILDSYFCSFRMNQTRIYMPSKSKNSIDAIESHSSQLPTKMNEK